MITTRKKPNEILNFSIQAANSPIQGDTSIDITIYPEASIPFKTGEQLLTEAIKEPTLDRYLDRSPKVGQPINYPELVRILQRKRAAFITAEQKKREPKIEGEDENEIVA